MPRCFIRQTRAARQEEIATSAGLTRGAVYSNFRDKDDLFIAYLEDCMSVESVEFERLLREAPDWPQRIASVGAYYARAHGKTSALVYSELLLAGVRHAGLRRKLRPIFESKLDVFSKLLAEIGGDVPADFRPTFLAMFSAIHGIALQRASGAVDAETAEAALRLVFNALGTSVVPQARHAEGLAR